MSPARKSALATTVMTLFLILFTFGGYWYGKNTVLPTAETIAEDTNANTVANSTSQPNVNQVTLSGKLASMSDTGLEVKLTGTDQEANQRTELTSTTTYRKLDFRSIPKNGVGDGVKIAKTDLKTGDEVVIVTLKEGATYKAEKVYLVLYP